VSSVFPYMLDSVQVSWRFNSVYIVILLLYLQNHFFLIQSERLLMQMFISTKSS